MRKLLAKLLGRNTESPTTESTPRTEIVLEMDGFTIKAWQRGDAKGVDIYDNRPAQHAPYEEKSAIYCGKQFAPPLQDDDHKDDEVLAIVSSPGMDDLDAHKPTIEGLIAALRRLERFNADIAREYAAKK